MDDVFRLRKYIYSDLVYINNFDGDTIRFRIRKGFDMGFGFTMYGEKEVAVRLMGIDTYELRDSDPERKKKAYDAKNMVRTKLLDAERDGEKVVMITFKDRTGKYGRYLGWIYIGQIDDEHCLNNQLKWAGLTTGKYEKDRSGKPHRTPTAGKE